MSNIILTGHTLFDMSPGERLPIHSDMQFSGKFAEEDNGLCSGSLFISLLRLSQCPVKVLYNVYLSQYLACSQCNSPKRRYQRGCKYISAHDDNAPHRQSQARLQTQKRLVTVCEIRILSKSGAHSHMRERDGLPILISGRLSVSENGAYTCGTQKANGI